MSQPILALSISSEDIKMAEISHVGRERTVRRLYHFLPDQENDEEIIDAAEIIKKLIQEDRPKTLKTVLVINSQDLDYKNFAFPFASPQKVTRAIGFETSSQYPPNVYVTDYIKSVTREPGKKFFLAAMANKAMLAKRVQEAEDAGLQIVGITSDISTIGNFFREEQEALVMEMGESQTLFALYSHGKPMLVRDIPIGIKETRKGAQGVQNQNLRPLLGEIKRTIHSFNARTNLNIGRVFVSGNILIQQELLKALKEDLDLEFVDQDASAARFKSEDVGQDLNVYASILGAGEWKNNGKSFNFFKDEFARSDPDSSRRQYIRWGFIAVLFCLFAVFSSSWFKIVSLEKRKDFLALDTRKTFRLAFPQTKRIVDEVRQAKNFLDALKVESGGKPSSETTVLDVLNIISQRIPADIPFHIVTLFWERGKIEISGTTDSFKTVNSIQELVSGAKEFSRVNISNAKSHSDGENVEFKITIRLAGKV